jgi:hypothetical protein
LLNMPNVVTAAAPWQRDDRGARGTPGEKVIANIRILGSDGHRPPDQVLGRLGIVMARKRNFISSQHATPQFLH